MRRQVAWPARSVVMALTDEPSKDPKEEKQKIENEYKKLVSDLVPGTIRRTFEQNDQARRTKKLALRLARREASLPPFERRKRV